MKTMQLIMKASCVPMSDLPFLHPGYTRNPPDNTLFLECYDISYQDERRLPVNIYQLTDRPEKMYIINPVEYSLEENELKLIERIRKKMIAHRPCRPPVCRPWKFQGIFPQAQQTIPV